MDNNLDLFSSTDNKTILEAFLKAKEVLSTHNNIVVSVSGGGDSDLIVDICEKLKGDKQITYVWFNTGLEYEATKRHLDYLERKYDIKIVRQKPIHSIPYCCNHYGLPFLSKFVSEAIGSLQYNGFKWEDKPYEVLIQEYPRIKSWIGWWCNHRDCSAYGYSIFNINYNKWLKEFLIANPPPFPVSAKCCTYSKKKPSRKFEKDKNADCLVMGIRKAEGGIRASKYKTCFDHQEKIDVFRPIFWLSDEDKVDYENTYNIIHSDCYSLYGLKRTGCVGCPFNRWVLEELETIKEYEPQMYKACMNIFGVSYEYTKKYRDFCEEMNKKEKESKNG